MSWELSSIPASGSRGHPTVGLELAPRSRAGEPIASCQCLAMGEVFGFAVAAMTWAIMEQSQVRVGCLALKPKQSKSKSKSKQKKSKSGRALPIAISAAVVVILAVIVIASLNRSTPRSLLAVGDPAPVSVVNNLTQIPKAVWSAVGTGGATVGEDVSKQSTDSFLYIGAEGCPFCAAERWPMIVALSHFGHFSGLTLMRSVSTDIHPNTPTFSFLHATYRSRYLHVALMEIDGRSIGPDGFYPPLMKLSAAQTKTFDKYDGPPYIPSQYAGSIPFVLVGDRYLWIGSTVAPSSLDGKTWAALSKAVNSGQGPVAHAILENANALTSAICSVDGDQPASVCKVIGASVPAKAVS